MWDRIPTEPKNDQGQAKCESFFLAKDDDEDMWRSVRISLLSLMGLDVLRYGGAMATDTVEDAANKAQDLERRKAEVRKRLEEAGQKKNKKKGFLTPERKKKLRKLLMMKAAEDLKQQQLLKEQERQKALQQRIVPMPDIDAINDQGKLLAIYETMFARVCELEEAKFDMNVLVSRTESEINELTIAVNDLRGKFVKPTLKKVSKYDNKFKQMEGGAPAKGNFRANLKVVKKESGIDDIMAKTKKSDGKPEWSKKPAELVVVDKSLKENNEEEEEQKDEVPASESTATNEAEGDNNQEQAQEAEDAQEDEEEEE
ncbi:unnamed protein product [Caenorhabditis auriculariae]|uniref:Uncharacterized protein n=1 Tax=Caenorhabditis auriculariae TaxID=2777116 RepID=A0A8S1HKU9_9PELO|nr:unnamed protein product [Caenorhabditis auriculariae]